MRRAHFDREAAAALCEHWGDVADLVHRLAQALRVADPGSLAAILADRDLAVLSEARAPTVWPEPGDVPLTAACVRLVRQAAAEFRAVPGDSFALEPPPEPEVRPRRKRGKR